MEAYIAALAAAIAQQIINYGVLLKCARIGG